MAQPRVAHEFESVYTKNFPMNASCATAATVILPGDFLEYTATGVQLVTAVTDSLTFIGIGRGKSTVNTVTGLTGEQTPVLTKCIVECDLVSADYEFGDGLGFKTGINATTNRNVLQDAAGTSANPTMAWFWGFTTGASVTRGLVMVDIYLLRTLFDANLT